MKTDAQILVATDAVSDAQLVKKLLQDEFDHVAVSTDAELAIQDFEKCRPQVLVLAFNSLALAQRYYLGLYRHSVLIHALPHRAVILCGKDDLQRVYELCRKEYFDDYVLFWPMVYDAPRLCMAIHNALRQITGNGNGTPTAAEFAAQARRIATLELLLEQSLERGFGHIEAAGQALEQAERELGAEQEEFFHALSEGARPDLIEMKDRTAFLQEIARMKAGQVDRHSHSIAAAVQPVRLWAAGIRDELAVPLASARTLQVLAERVRPLVLVVDDDEFQHLLLSQMLAQANVELIFAVSGAEAFATLRKRRPDLILMDIHLPGMDGVEVTRRLKAVEQFVNIPVVMITGKSEKGAVVESLKVGAADFLVKPIERDILLSKMRNLLTDAC